MIELKWGEGQKQKAQSISWREWEKCEGKFLILALFGPAKYPSYTLTFLDDKKNLRVRKSLKEEHAKEIARFLVAKSGKAYIELKKTENGWVVKFDRTQDPEFYYNIEGKSLILRRKKEEIPF